MIRTGIDIVKVERINKLCEDPDFVERIFTSSEFQYRKSESIAGIFALKEAFFKATQIKIRNWHEIVVKHHDNGKPYIVFDENLLDFKIKDMDCSIAHDGEYAIGSVVIES